MGKVLSVTSFEEMSTVSRELMTASTNYTDIYTQLMNAASNMGTAWEAADNQAFVSQITEFTAKLKAMALKLEDASKALQKQCDNYVQRQDFNIAEVSKLSN